MRAVSACLPFLLLLACTTTAAVPGARVGVPETEATIRSMEDQERLGVLKQDTAALRRIWSEQFTVNSPTNQIAPSAAIVMDLMRKGFIHYSSFERRIEHLRVDGNIAVVMGGETVQPIGNTPLAGQTVQRRFTHVWRRDSEGWHLVVRHANNILP